MSVQWRDKLDTLVEFPLTGLDMAPYVLSEQPEGVTSLSPSAVAGSSSGTGASLCGSSRCACLPVVVVFCSHPQLSRHLPGLCCSLSTECSHSPGCLSVSILPPHPLLVSFAGPSLQPLLYDCFGVVNHFGSMAFGHYTAFTNHAVARGQVDEADQ